MNHHAYLLLFRVTVTDHAGLDLKRRVFTQCEARFRDGDQLRLVPPRDPAALAAYRQGAKTYREPAP